MLPKELVDLPGQLTTIGVVPGFGGGPKGYEPLLLALNNLGHRVIFFPSVRRDDPWTRQDAAAYWQYPQVFARQAHHTIGAIDELNIKKMVLLGHSMGSPIATICGARHKNVIRRVINMCPSGTYKLTHLQLIQGMLAKRRADRLYAQTLPASLQREIIKIAGEEAKQYSWTNPVRAFCEARMVGRFTAITVAARNHLDAYYVAGMQDPLFTHQRVQAAAASLGPGRFISVDCGHDPHTKFHEAVGVAAALHNGGLLNLL